MRKSLIVLVIAAAASAQTGKHRSVMATITPPTSTMVLWYSADCITGPSCAFPSNGTTVSSWYDRSPTAANGNVNSGTCTLNTAQINGKPAVSFSSCHVRTGVDLSGTAGAATIFIVRKLTSTGAKSTITGATPGGGGYLAYWTASSGKAQGLDDANIVVLGTGTASADTSWHQTNARWTSGVAPIFRLDRVNDATLNSHTTGFSSNIGYVGWNGPCCTENLNGELAEIIIYNSQLSTTDRDTVESYLHSKYGL